MKFLQGFMGGAVLMFLGAVAIGVMLGVCWLFISVFTLWLGEDLGRIVGLVVFFVLSLCSAFGAAFAGSDEDGAL